METNRAKTQPGGSWNGTRKTVLSLLRAQMLGLCVGLVLLGSGCGGKEPAAEGAAKKGAPKVAPVDTSVTAKSTTNSLAVRSVFVADLEQGRDPFFPLLKKKEPEPGPGTATTPAAAPDALLTVKNILQYGGKIVARVNDAILEPGRAAMVTTKTGERWRVHCVAVTSQAVTVRIEGQGNNTIVLPVDGN